MLYYYLVFQNTGCPISLFTLPKFILKNNTLSYRVTTCQSVVFWKKIKKGSHFNPTFLSHALQIFDESYVTNDTPIRQSLTFLSIFEI